MDNRPSKNLILTLIIHHKWLGMHAFGRRFMILQPIPFLSPIPIRLLRFSLVNSYLSARFSLKMLESTILSSLSVSLFSVYDFLYFFYFGLYSFPSLKISFFLRSISFNRISITVSKRTKNVNFCDSSVHLLRFQMKMANVPFFFLPSSPRLPDMCVRVSLTRCFVFSQSHHKSTGQSGSNSS